MPKRPRDSVYKPRKKRRVMRKRRRVLRPRIPRGPFPVSKIAKLRLATNKITLTMTNGAIGSQDINANWPQYGSRNAFGWDQWTALYNQATCIGSKITVYHYGTGTASATPFIVGIYLADDSTNYTDYRSLIEARRGRWMRVTNNVSSVQPRCTAKFSAKKFFNVKDVKDNVDHIGAAVTESAAVNPALYKLWAQPVDQTASSTATITAIIDYIMVFAEPKDPAAS